MDFGGLWLILSGFWCILNGIWWILNGFWWILVDFEWIRVGVENAADRPPPAAKVAASRKYDRFLLHPYSCFPSRTQSQNRSIKTDTPFIARFAS